MSILIPKAIVVHCSASKFGDADLIRGWHQQQGWTDIGYHGVILNGYRHYGSAYRKDLDGKIEPGRPDDIQGAHCKAKGMNTKALGVCLIGLPGWTPYTFRQLDALVHYLVVKCKAYGIKPSAITQHSDHEPGKPFCASINIEHIRARVAEALTS